MKIRKLMAALLCVAMTVTSPCVSAMASTDMADSSDILLVESGDEVSVDTAAEEVSGTVSDTVAVDASVDVVFDDSEEVLSQEDLAADDSVDKIGGDEEEGDAPDEEVIDDNILPVKYAASDCFDPNSTVLAMTPDKVGKKVSNFTSEPVIPKNVEVIPAGFFEGDTGISVVYFEDGSKLTTIEEEAFKGSSLTMFTAPDTYTEIAPSTFEDCTSLKGFSFGKITKIGDKAFAGCTSLGTDMTLIAGGSKVSEIGERAFAGCNGFVNLDLSAKFTASTISVDTGAFANCSNLTQAKIPAGFTSVPASCFAGCEKLTTVTMGKKVSYIGDSAFEGCKLLTRVTFNTTEEDTSLVASVGDKAFKTCTSLVEITFPRACENFGDYIFQGCSKLKDVYFTCHDDDMLATSFVIGDNAFSGISDVTVHGYDEKVLDFCTAKSIKYKSLNSVFNVTLGKHLKAYGDCKLGGMGLNVDRKGVPVGSKVYFTVYPKNGAVLIDNIWDTNDENLKFQYVQGGPRQPIFCFDMPAHNVEINAEYISGQLLNALNLYYSIGTYNETLCYFTEDDKNWKTEKSGNRGLLNVGVKGVVNGTNYDYKLGVWNLTFTPKNPAVATIDATGLITAKAAGTTQMIAQIVGTGKYVAFNLTVDRTVEFDRIEFTEVEFINHPGKNPGDAYITGEDIYYDEEPDKVFHPYIINYLKNELSSQDRRFKIKFKAYNSENGEMFIPATWSVSNTNIATLADTTTSDNYNTVIVKQGTSGTVLIKASYNTGKKYSVGKNIGKPIIRSAYAILNIVDPAPSTASAIIVNKQKTMKKKDNLGNLLSEDQQDYGALIPIVANADYPFDSIYEELYYKDKATNTYKIFKGLRLKYTGIVKDGNPQYRLYVTENDATVNALALKKELTYKGDTKLYFRGTFSDATMGDFYSGIETLSIINMLPEPKLSKTGDINTFYNSSCYDISAVNYIGWDDIMGKNVKKTAENIDLYAARTIGANYINQGYTKANAEVDYDRSTIVSDENYARYMLNKRESDIVDTAIKPDPLRNNFVLLPDPDSENNFMIRRTAKEMKKDDKGNDVNMGYIFIYYKGFKEPYITRLKVGTKNTPPVYTMSQTSATASVLSGAATLKFKFLSKKTGEAAFTSADVASFKTLQDKSAYGVFKNPTPGTDDYWELPFNSPSAGKKVAVMELKLKNWDKVQTCAFTVNVTDVLATARLSRPAVNLNASMTGPEAVGESNLVISHADATASVEAIEFTGAAALATEAMKLDIAPVPSLEHPNECMLNVSVLSPDIKKGAYRFKITPHADYESGASKTLKDVYLNVVVADTAPILKLNAASATFNLDYPGKETQKLVVASIGGLPAGIAGAEVKEADGEGMLIDISELDFTFAGNLKNATLVKDADCVKAALQPGIMKKKDERTNKWYYIITLVLNDLGTEFSGTALNMPFTISGIKVNGAYIRPFKFIMRSTRNAPSIQVKATEGINSVDPYSRYRMALTVRNLVNPEISDLKIKVFDKVANDLVIDDQFKVDADPDDDKIWYLYANHDLDADPETRFRIGKHEIYLEYTIAGKDFPLTKLTVLPQQVLPRLVQDIQKAVFFWNAPEADRVVTYKLTKTSALRSHIDFNNVIISDTNPSELKNAFEVTYEDTDLDPSARENMKTTLKSWEAGYVTIKCVKPNQLQAGKTYVLKLEAICDGQFYKRDVNGDLALDDYNNPILTTGQIINVPVVVQK